MKKITFIFVILILSNLVYAGQYQNLPLLHWSSGTPGLQEEPSLWGTQGYLVESDPLTGAGNTEAGSLHLDNAPGYFFYGDTDYPANPYIVYTMYDDQNIYIGVKVWDEVIDDQGTGGRMDRSDFIQYRIDGNNCQVDFQPGLQTEEDWTADGWTQESSWAAWMQSNPDAARLFLGGVVYNGEWTTMPAANGETGQSSIWHTSATTTPNYTIGNNVEGEQNNWGSITGIWEEGYWINCWWDISTLMNGNMDNWQNAIGLNIVCKDVDGEEEFANNDHNRIWLSGPLGTDGELVSNLFFGPGSEQTPPLDPEYIAVRWVCAQPRLWASVMEPADYTNIRISEFLVSNAQICMDPDYKDFCDWIELYNDSNLDTELGGMYLTDDLDILLKWQIPAGTVIPAYGYIVFWADDQDIGLHTNFKLSQEGEDVGLSTAQGILIDHVSYEEIATDVSLSKIGANWKYCGEPSPGCENTGVNTGFQEFSSEVSFLTPPGFYTNSVQLVIFCQNPAEIYYTTDGSYPDSGSDLYSQPLIIDSTTVIRARAFENGLLPGEVNTGTYFINEENHLSIVSISLEPEYYWDNEIGIYPLGNGYNGYDWETANFYQDWERPAAVEIFDINNVPLINQRIGIKISGGGPRKVPLRSMALYGKDKYDDDDLDCEFFGWKTADSFRRMNLRNSGNDWEYTLIRDAMMQNIIRDRMDIDFLGYIPCEIYLNGSYWGILNMREKADEYWVESNYNLDPDDNELDMIAMQDELLAGDMLHWNAFYSFLENNELSDPGNYDYVCTQMDINEYLNYLISQVYFGNTDWPGHNLKYWRPRTADGKWRWLIFDLDFGFGLNQYNGGQPYKNTLEYVSSPNGTNHNPPWSTLIIRKLFENENFVNEFSQRMITHINTTFSAERIIAIIDDMENTLEPFVERYIEVWGNTDTYHQHNSFASIEEWHDNIQVLRNYAQERPDYVIGHIINKFPAVYNFTPVEVTNITPEWGKILINGVEIIEGHYLSNNFINIPLRLEAIPAPGYVFSSWDTFPAAADSVSFILNEPVVINACFEPENAPALPSIVINEFMADNETTIMDNNGEYDDWIEIYNYGSETVDIGGFYITDDSSDLTQWLIPQNNPQTIIPPGEFLLLWADRDTEQGVLHIDIKLSADGEEIFLSHANGFTIIDSIVFSAQLPDISYGRFPDAGNWYSMDTPTPEAPNYYFAHIYGDADDNGEVEAYDCSLILQYVVGLYPEEWQTWQDIIADVDQNNVIDAYDAANVLRYVTGIISELPLSRFLAKKQPVAADKTVDHSNRKE